MIYFEQHEFKCKCGECGMGLKDMDVDFVKRLDLARSIAKTPFTINSAVRCPEHNEREGGRPRSAHLSGNAADISCKQSHKRFLIIEALLKAGFNRIGIYDKFIHVDNDETKPARVVWIDGG